MLIFTEHVLDSGANPDTSTTDTLVSTVRSADLDETRTWFESKLVYLCWG